MKTINICVAGEIFIDVVMSGLDAWPEPGKEVFARAFHRDIGGGTAITACALARLGCHPEVLVSIGKDNAEWVTRRLRSCGVGSDLVTVHDSEPTAFTVVATRPEDRAFITYPGANRAFPALLDSWVEDSWLQKDQHFPDHVHIAAPLPLDSAGVVIRAIQSRGATVSLDVGWHEGWLKDERSLAVARQVDIFFPNEVEAACMTGQNDPGAILEVFRSNGFRRVVVKLGPKGAIMLWDGAIHHASPFPVACVDTTGAGDCFNAGFLQGWLFGDDPARCLLKANLCGALSTKCYGGLTGVPDAGRLEDELKRTQQT